MNQWVASYDRLIMTQLVTLDDRHMLHLIKRKNIRLSFVVNFTFPPLPISVLPPILFEFHLVHLPFCFYQVSFTLRPFLPSARVSLICECLPQFRFTPFHFPLSTISAREAFFSMTSFLEQVSLMAMSK